MIMSRLMRVLVANQPKLMREVILAMFADQPDMEIVGEVSDEGQIQDCVNQTSPDLLVIALDVSGRRPHICDTVLKAHPELLIIAVSSGQDWSVCYSASVQIQSNNIEPTEEGILNAARKKAMGAGGLM
jgi:chemotaxis response regulator CheB